MKKWLKVLLGLIALLLLVTAILYTIFLKANYIAEPPLAGKLSEVSIKSNGQDRTFLWYAPKTIRSTALIFVLHGSTGTGKGVREQTAYEFDLLAEKEGFVVVYPTGYFNHWNDCRASADYQANTDNIDDLPFLKAIESHISKNINRTFTHRFATGHSNGGHFCYKLALEAPDWIDGIAPISASLPIDTNLDCQKNQQFVPIFLINGTKDKVNPYEGGLVSIMGNDSRGTVLSTDATMKYWTQLGTCLPTPSVTTSPDISKNDQSRIEQFIWLCDGQPKALLYKVVGGGHTIPNASHRMPAILGATNQDINIAVEVWRFFKRQM